MRNLNMNFTRGANAICKSIFRAVYRIYTYIPIYIYVTYIGKNIYVYAYIYIYVNKLRAYLLRKIIK